MQSIWIPVAWIISFCKGLVAPYVDRSTGISPTELTIKKFGNEGAGQKEKRQSVC